MNFFQFKAKIDVKAHLSITVEMNTHTEVSQSSSTWLLSPVGFEFEGFWKKKKEIRDIFGPLPACHTRLLIKIKIVSQDGQASCRVHSTIYTLSLSLCEIFVCLLISMPPPPRSR